ncbi:hypothetical protein [Mycolicibacterium elephantis]|uniref:Uncharacterized protein n=1 Tax=Mycolicibacterium elephantis DSM 44368 TaxID=1335622 RepID=A0A439DMI1_9MYCO|nr:hypothetical protein [Mycolicibacterium elephantis]MCV7220107.1 hypothetical protein [Mycolicibacterium elephantis]RWA16042.1 hypothetical protein MELE44368_08355 [Mycolicibacterium elephantis DSM 44368]
MKYTHGRGARIALMASAAPVLAALIVFNPFIASADTGEEDQTSTGPSSGISISSGPVTGSTGTIVVTDDKPVGGLVTPGVDTSTDIVNTEPKVTIGDGRNGVENPEWIPDIGVDAPNASDAPARTPFDVFFGVSP